MLKFTHLSQLRTQKKADAFRVMVQRIYNLGQVLSDLNTSNIGQNYINKNIHKATEREKTLQNTVSIFQFLDETQNEQSTAYFMES